MIYKIRPKKIAASSAMVAVALWATASFTAAQSPEASAGQEASAPAQSLDYEIYKSRVEPIFLKKRAGHARCYVCHSKAQGGTLSSGNLAGQLDKGFALDIPQNAAAESTRRERFEAMLLVSHHTGVCHERFLRASPE